ncbi:MAG: VIT1/CCC1 transporter family protein [Alphaproteobacteria bacterium]|nr:VIT1/CCC1 transporter family protein [Alphaproteobacteria bacterium]
MPVLGDGLISQRVRRFLPELIYGANDGIVTTFAVVAGVVGADLSVQIILILGFANLFADGVSMGASNVLSLRSREVDRPTLIEALPYGAATFVGFLAAGLVPLLAYLLPVPRESSFIIAVGLAGATLFGVGASRSALIDRRWYAAGLEMLAIGATAGAIAYWVGVLGAYLANGTP